jgi:O-antigen ligase
MKKIPILLLSALLIFLPFKDLFWFNQSINLLKIYIPFLIYLYLIFVLTGLIKIKKIWLDIFFVLLFFKTFSLVGSIWSGHQLNIWGYSRDVADILLMVFTASIVNSEKKIKIVSYSLISIFFVASLVLIALYFSNRNLLFSLGMEKTTADDRGGIGNPHDFAQSLSWIIPINIYFLIAAIREKRKKLSIFLIISLITIFISSLISFSRSPVFITVFIAFLIFIKEKLFLKKEFIFIMALLLMVVLFIFSYRQSFKNYFEERYFLNQNKVQQIYYQEAGFNLRKVLARSALLLFIQNPIFGVGPGNFVNESVKITQLEMSAENVYLQILAENGLIFIVVSGGIIIYLFFSLRKKNSTNNLYFVAYNFVFLSLLLNGVFNISQADPTFFILLGLVFSNFFISQDSLSEEKISTSQS